MVIMLTDVFDNKLSFFVRHIWISLLSIVLVGLTIRLYFFSFEVPPTLDSLLYFKYAIDLVIFKQFPPTYDFPNNGWPLFIASFFSVLPSSNFFNYVNIQQLLSISISALTVIPVYMLCSRFVEKPYALLGTILFGFEPHIIENSIYGLSDAVFIFLVTLSIFFLHSTKREIIFAAFGVVSIATIIRYEGLVTFFVLTIIFLIRFRSTPKRAIWHYLICTSIFIAILLPVSYLRVEITGEDGILSSFIGGVKVYHVESIEKEDSSSIGTASYVTNGIVNLFRSIGLVLFPTFIVFAPLGMFIVLRNKSNLFTIIIALTLLSLPSLYANSRGIQEPRYLLVILPWFALLTAIAAKSWINKSKRNRSLFFFSICIILCISVGFLFWQIDRMHEKESYLISKYVVNHTYGVNQYYPESKYIHASIIEKNWNFVRPYIEGEVTKSSIKTIVNDFPVLPVNEFVSLEDFIRDSESKNLSHLVLDGKSNRPSFLNDVFYHEEKYPFLIKTFDSRSLGYSYHVKIYKIDYEKFHYFSTT